MDVIRDLLTMPCPCESGERFKACCYNDVISKLPEAPTAEEIAKAVQKEAQARARRIQTGTIDRKTRNLVAEGVEMRTYGRPDRALECLIYARKRCPHFASAWNQEAQTLWQLGRLEEAITRQKQGLEHAPKDVYGWAQLATFHYFLTQEETYETCLQKATALVPTSAADVECVCTAFALKKRHHDIIQYAENSPYSANKMVAYYLALAYAIIDDRKKAAEAFIRGKVKTLRERPSVRACEGFISMDSDSLDDFCNFEMDDLAYFSLEDYPASHLIGPVFATPRPEYANIVCDVIEFIQGRNVITLDDLLDALAPYDGARVEELRTRLEKNCHFRRPPKSNIAGKIGDELAIQRFLMSQKHYPVIFAPIAGAPEYHFEAPEDEAYFMDAVLLSEAENKTNAWKTALPVLKDIHERHPGCYAAALQYAQTLARNQQNDEALALLSETIQACPTFIEAGATLIQIALKCKKITVIQTALHTVQMPLATNPYTYIEWQKALSAYAKTIRDPARASVADKMIRSTENFLRRAFM